MKAHLLKAIHNPAIWGPLLAVVAIGAGVGFRVYLDSDQTDAGQVSSQVTEDPVYYPPQRIEPSAVVIESQPNAVERIAFDDDLLQRARSYRLAKIQAMEDELKISEVGVSDGQLTEPGLMTPPTPPSGMPQADSTSSSPLGVAMIVMGQVPMAWLSQGNNQPQPGRVGESVHGKKIASISPDRVCFSDKSCLRVN